MVRLSPVLAAQDTYPFVRLDEAKRRAVERGVEVIDFGIGDPREPTDPAIVRALVDALPLTQGYPRAQGLPELREAIAAWAARRFGVELDEATEIVPTFGSKEAIFTFAQLFADPAAGRDTVLVTEPGYPVPGRGGEFAKAEVLALPLTEEHGFLPDLEAVPGDVWSRTAVLWLNYPNNPTGAVAPLSFLRAAAELAAAHDVILASDEAYTELWFDEPPHSVLEVRRHRRARRGLQLALEAFVHDRLPERLSRGRHRDRRRAQALSAVESGPRPRSSSSAPRSWPGTTRTTWSGTARSTAASAPCCSACASERACA